MDKPKKITVIPVKGLEVLPEVSNKVVTFKETPGDSTDDQILKVQENFLT